MTTLVLSKQIIGVLLAAACLFYTQTVYNKRERDEPVMLSFFKVVALASEILMHSSLNWLVLRINNIFNVFLRPLNAFECHRFALLVIDHSNVKNNKPIGFIHVD
jgi:hypothetical protein